MINLSYCVYLLLVARLEEQRERRRQIVRKSREKNPEKAAESSRRSVKKFREKNPERCREAVKKYRSSEKGKNQLKRYFQERKKKKKSQEEKDIRNAYLLKRYHSDPEYRLIVNYRTRLNNALKHNWKSGNTITLLGCSVTELRAHLEKQFQPGMTWENYGCGWHVDHIRPCANFENLADPDQQRKCFHFSNLQPLWALENLKKGDSYGGG